MERQITVSSFVAADARTWPALRRASISVEPTLRHVVAAGFGEEPVGDVQAWDIRRERDGVFECVSASLPSEGALKVWVRPWGDSRWQILRVVGAAHAQPKEAFQEGFQGLRPGPEPILYGVAVAGRRRMVRRSWVLQMDPDGPRRLEVLIAVGSFGYRVRAGCWRRPGERAHAPTLRHLFELAGPGPRRGSDLPEGLALVRSQAGAWRVLEAGLFELERPVIELLIRSAGIRRPGSGVPRLIAGVERYMRVKHR